MAFYLILDYTEELVMVKECHVNIILKRTIFRAIG